jgi:hypothetical protein
LIKLYTYVGRWCCRFSVLVFGYRQEERIAVAGGLINDVAGVRPHCPVIVGVAFLGEGMCVASTVLDQDVATEHDADKAMQEVYTKLFYIIYMAVIS